MSTFDLQDIYAIEEGTDDEVTYYQAIQRAINAGHWSLQGSYGRTMMEAIEAGACLLGPSSARDYWGNYIPSRDDVQQGTKGSADFVEDRNGAEWLADMLAA